MTLANSSGLASSLTSMLTSLMDNFIHDDTKPLLTATISGRESLTKAFFAVIDDFSPDTYITKIIINNYPFIKENATCAKNKLLGQEIY